MHVHDSDSGMLHSSDARERQLKGSVKISSWGDSAHDHGI